VIGERRWGIHHDVVEHPLEDPQDVGDEAGGDPFRSSGLERRDEGGESGGVWSQQGRKSGFIQGAGKADRVGDRVGRE
jgi:hypothetical protein